MPRPPKTSHVAMSAVTPMVNDLPGPAGGAGPGGDVDLQSRRSSQVTSSSLQREATVPAAPAASSMPKTNSPPPPALSPAHSSGANRRDLAAKVGDPNGEVG